MIQQFSKKFIFLISLNIFDKTKLTLSRNSSEYNDILFFIINNGANKTTKIIEDINVSCIDCLNRKKYKVKNIIP